MDEQIPPGGHPIISAVLTLVAPADVPAVEHYINTVLGRSIHPPSEAPTFLQHLWSRLRDRACVGEVMFKGVKQGEDVQTLISPAQMRDSVPDFDRHTVLAAGTLFHGVRVFLADGEPSKALASLPPESPNNSAPQAVANSVLAIEWMRANVTSYKAKQRDARISECRIALNISKTAALNAWNKLPESIKGRSRRPKP